jgi:phosphoglycerol transferase
LGALGAAGLVISIGALVVDRRRQGWPGLRRRSGVLNVLAVLLGAAGGASLLLGMAGFLQLRAYARLTVFIGFFSLVALGAALAPLLESARRRWPRRAMTVAGVLAVTVAAVAVLDQTPREPPGGTTDIAAAGQDRALAAAVERRLGPGATVLQLPLMGFPEDAVHFPPRVPALNPVVTGQEVYNGYELFRPSLHTDTVGWSYGRVQARPGDLQPALANKPVDRFLTEAVAAGFDGLYMDRAGFPDYGFQLEGRLADRIGPPALRTPDNRIVFFDLREYARQWAAQTPPDEVAALRDQARHPLELEWGEGFEEADGVGRFFPQLTGFTSGRSAAGGAVLAVTNPGPESRTLVLHATARLSRPGEGRLLVGGAAEGAETTIAATGTPVTVRVTAPAGTSRTTFRAELPEPGDGERSTSTGFRLEDTWWTG